MAPIATDSLFNAFNCNNWAALETRTPPSTSVVEPNVGRVYQQRVAQVPSGSATTAGFKLAAPEIVGFGLDGGADT